MKNQKMFADKGGWRTLSRKIIHANPFLELAEEHVTSPGCPEGKLWTVVDRRTAVVVAPMTADGRLLLIRQERIPVRQAIWEFPAGQIDDSHSPTEAQAKATAKRELTEETGFRLAKGGTLTPLGIFYSSPGFTSEHAHLFFATPVEPDPRGSRHDHAETITEARLFTRTEFRRMIASGEISDANTLTAFARMTALGLFNKKPASPKGD